MYFNQSILAPCDVALGVDELDCKMKVSALLATEPLYVAISSNTAAGP